MLAPIPVESFIHGVILAIGLVVPLGPQNLFVFSRGANSRRLIHAIPAVTTAAMCDTLLILLAVVGISAVVLQLPFLKVSLLTVGIAFLLYIGWVTWKSRPNESDGDHQGRRRETIRSQIFFAASVSLLNPHAILDTVAVIGTSSLIYTGTAKVFFTVATVCVSWSWFFFLAIAGRIVGRIEPVRAWLNRVSAVLMWATAIYLITQF